MFHFDAIDILKYPYVHERSRSLISYQNHIQTECGTVKYKDMKKVLAVIISSMITTFRFSVVFVVGDQHTLNRILWLIRKKPQEYKRIVPLPGDFHTDRNFLMGVHALYFSVFVEGVFRMSGFGIDSIVENWSSMELNNIYRHAYETLLGTIMTYLIDVIPISLLLQPSTFISMAEEVHPGLAVTLHFAFDVALPWLYFKRSIRCGNAEDMISFYGMALDVFRAVRKIHYAILVVDYFPFMRAWN